jgi:GT2 family glycosyltransferase
MNPAPAPELSIIIVNWNSAPYLRECLTSVRRSTGGLRLEIIVVDSHSSEPGVDQVKEEFPEILLIKSEINLGFAGANNLGFERSSSPYLLFLNPDTNVPGPALQTMLAQLKSLPEAGIVGCKLLNTDGSIQLSCIQKFPTILNQVADIQYLQLRWPHCRLWTLDPLFAENPRPVPVEVISGACMMMERKVFQEVGKFSEEYFMYAEDLDLCHKVVHAGFVNYFVGEATVIHHGGKSSGRRDVSEWATRMKFRAILQFCKKTRGPFYSWMFRLAMGGVAISRLLLLAIASPFLGAEPLAAVSSKWRAILKWAAGMDRLPLKTAANT